MKNHPQELQNPHGKSAVLLINLGSPAAPTAAALRPYLREFLSDKRVIDLPRWQWLPILYAIVLLVRPKRSAALYEKVWMPEGAPLVVITEAQTDAVRQALQERGQGDVLVDYAMRYGAPSVADKINSLKAQGVTRFLFIPMYPQYADATTASVMDAVHAAMTKARFMPEYRFVHHWHDDPDYIQALADSYHTYAAQYGEPQELLLSFHGVPKRYCTEGDPYYRFCQETAKLLSDAIALPDARVRTVFQSRFGNEEWLKPYADETIESLPAQGIKNIAVMCPGFTADCLETLEEMAETNRELFMEHGGETYRYIPALNAEPAHINLLLKLIDAHTRDWANWSDDD